MTGSGLMQAVVAHIPGGPEVLALRQRDIPQPGPGEVLIRVAAAGVNRPDIMQRRGALSVPDGVTDVLGLEVAGVVTARGPGVVSPAVGERVMALVNGGGYAQYCLAVAGHCLPAPPSLDDEQAAALPEALFTIWHNLYELGRLAPGETVLLHGGASGLGTLAIQLARHTGARVIATAGSTDKTAAMAQLGAHRVVNYREEDFVAAALAATDGRGVDVVLDIVGGSYIERNLAAMAPGARHVSLSFIEASVVPINLQTLMSKGLTMTSSTLRPRSAAQKTLTADRVRRHFLPLIEDARVIPRLHAVYDLQDVQQAHRTLDGNANIGKVVLKLATRH